MKVQLPPIKRRLITFTIIGTSPLIQHKWSEKAKKQIRDKQAGKKTKVRVARKPKQEYLDATYFTEDGQYGIPAMSFKTALITAAHKDIGIEKTLVKKALFLHCGDKNMVVPMTCSDPIMREDTVRVGMSSADLRYRPEFREWSVELTMEFDAEMLRVEDIVNLIDRAGFGVGLNEMRPEKGGEYGRFCIDRSSPVEVTDPAEAELKVA